MSKHNKNHHLFSVILLGLLVFVSLACGSSTAEQLANVSETQTPISNSNETQEQSTTSTQTTEDDESADVVATQPAEPTSTPKPTTPPATPTPEPEEMKLLASGFGQDDRQVGFAFVIENPNSNLAIENSRYQIAAYDGNDTVVKTDSGYIELLLPQQTLGVSGSLFLDEGIEVARIEVQLSDGDIEYSDSIPTFTTTAVIYTEAQFSSYVTGVINSPYSQDLESLRISAVLYNETGEIIGGGFTYLNFVLANGTTGVKISTTARPDVEVASVELYPTVSSLSLLFSAEDMPTGATNLEVQKYGFGQEDTSAGYGFLIENPNAGFALENSQYHLTAYAEDGSVVTVDEGYIELVLPQQILGIGGDLFLDEGNMIASIDVQVKAGDFVESEILPLFTSENVTFQAGQFSDKVTGEIVSPYSSDVTDLRVSAILYDENGEIIGGGYTYLDFVPANGKAAAEVSVTTGGTPVVVELYAALSALSEFN